MSEDLYAKELLRWAADVSRTGRLEAPGASATEINAMCGDRVTLDFALDTDRQITDCRHETRACVLTQASASLLAAKSPGETAEGLKTLRTQVKAMLEAGSPAPGGVWAAYEIFGPAAQHKSRHRCVLLPLDAALKALEERG